MVVLILVVVWVVALTPYALRKLGEWQKTAQVDRFRRGLGALRSFAATGDGELPLDAEAYQPGSHDLRAAGTDGQRRAGPAKSARLSSQTVMRRRRTLLWLFSSLVGSFIFGAIPWFRPLWDLSLVVLILTVAYLAALVALQRQAVLAAERQAKVVRLQAMRAARGAAAATSARQDPVAEVAARVSPAQSAIVTAELAVAAGGARGGRPVVVAMPRRPSFVLVEGPSS